MKSGADLRREIMEGAGEIRAIAERFAWVDDVRPGPSWYTLAGIVKPPAGASPVTARETRGRLLGQAEALLEALEAAGWQFTDGIELGFRTEMERALRTVDGAVAVPAEQMVTTLSVEVLIEPGKGERKPDEPGPDGRDDHRVAAAGVP